jgi:epothilone polyketide synthase D
MYSGDPEAIGAYSGIGSVYSVAAGRIAYSLGLKGPALAIDTACSSSLVAAHMAVRSLRSGETNRALVAGVNLMLSPESTIYFSKLNALSPDGRCKTFSAQADGYGRGEGCGVLVLKRLTDAVADQDRILAVIRGSAVNQDGRSAGLTAPNGPSQQAVIHEALTDAGVRPEQVSFVEAHGTGTPLGDPIEVQALGNALETGRDPNNPVLLGSVKTNIGHTEGAAGVAGLIKLALMIEHDTLVPHLHFNEPSQHIPWNRVPVKVCTETKPWPGLSRVCGISGFGLSGTNAHLILDAGPKKNLATATAGWRPLILSAHSETAVHQAVSDLDTYLDQHPAQWLQIAHTANALRAHHSHRLAIVGHDASSAKAALAAAIKEPTNAISNRIAPDAENPKVAFLFTGQGSQYTGMGKDLYEAYPAFREIIDRCDALFTGRPHSLKAVLFNELQGAPLNDTGYTQPALYALQVALATLWRSWGIEAQAMLGHSIGELSAAHLAGIFSLEDGFKLVAERGRLMSALPRDGSMVALFTDEANVKQRLKGLEANVTIAAINAPNEIVIAGVTKVVDSVMVQAEADGIKAKKLRVSHAFHSPLMEPMLDDFRQVASQLTYSAPTVPIASNLTGALETTALCEPEYWVRHVRNAVRFPDGMRALNDYEICIEIGPRPTLLLLGQRCKVSPHVWIPSLVRGENEQQTILAALANAAVHDLTVSWEALDKWAPLPIPTSPFERKSFWLDRPTGHNGPIPLSGSYQLQWDPSSPPRASQASSWLIIGDNPALRDDLSARTDSVHTASLPNNEEEWRGLLATHSPAATILCPPNDLGPDALYTACLALCQAALETPTQVIICTHGATTGVHPTQAIAWGLGRTLQAEQPQLSLQLIDLDDQSQPKNYIGSSEHSQVRIINGKAQSPRLTERNSYPQDLNLGDGPVLITGGYGSVGLSLCGWLGDQGANHLILVGRNGPKEAALTAIKALEARGLTIEVKALDISKAIDTQAYISSLDSLQAVFHAAGVLDDGLLPNQTAARFARVSNAKIAGSTNLHEATKNLDLKAFVLFSSAAAVIGSPGQCNYAAANAFQDALALHRRALGLAATSVAFGPWAGSQMATGDERDRWSRRGIQTSQAVDQLHRMSSFIDDSSCQGLAMEANWETLVEHQGYVAEVLKNLVSAPAQSTTTAFTGLTPRQRHSRLLEAIEDQAKLVLGLEEAIDHSLGLFDAGLDSLMAVELSRRIERSTGLAVPTTLVFEQATIQAIAEWLNSHFEADEEHTTATHLTAASNEGIAIVGIGCRFPGQADAPDDFWQNLIKGHDAVGSIPSDRWDIERYHSEQRGTPGKAYTKSGAFINDVKGFDAAFFGVSPREAARIDPQQRLLLEVSWEALENAGIGPLSLRESPTGVFVGIAASDYMQRISPTSQTDTQDMYSGTGNDSSFSAGRIAYVLGTHGPAMAINTACSSSLVAAHLACQSLRSGECDQALVAGVNLMLSPEPTVYLSQIGALSPTGRCATFDASADGYVRGEGCGVVVLKRLSQAKADGDPIIAVIRGSALNHDGPSSGLTVPNGSAQRSLIASALHSAAVAPEEVHYIEAHGTGTSLGDPIEVAALGAIYGDRSAPLYLGSVKTNIGHLEAGAGIAGLIKTALALQHRTIPPQVHFNSINPSIDQSFPFEIPTSPTDWPKGPAIAGLSSFGLSGTNAHMILSEAPPSEPLALNESCAEIIPLSAKNTAAFEALREGLLSATAQSSSLRAVSRTASVGRAHFSTRTALIASSLEDLRDQLKTLAPPKATPTKPKKLAFLFTGQGSQYPGMGRDLYKRFPLYQQHIDHCDALLGVWQGYRLKQVLFDEIEGTSPIHDTGWTQPALFTLQVGLAKLFQSWGIEAELVIGHSIGELSAACVAGILSLEDGLSLVAARGRLMSALPREGTMAAIFADESQVSKAIAARTDVGIAALNGPTETVISGSNIGVEAVLELLGAQGVEYRPLTVSHAFHSHLMEPMLDEFEAIAEQLSYAQPKLQVISNIDSSLPPSALCEASYWRRHIRGAVRFADGVSSLMSEGATLFIELGPQPVLTSMVSRIVTTEAPTSGFALRRAKPELDTLYQALATCYQALLPIRWAGVYPPEQTPPTRLPNYPFQRSEQWIPYGEPLRVSTPPAVLRSTWLEQQIPSVPVASGEWLVFQDNNDLARPYIELLTPANCTILRAADAPKAEDISSWLSKHLSSSTVGIIYAWAGDIEATGDLNVGLGGALVLFQQLCEQGLYPPIHLLSKGDLEGPSSLSAALQQGLWSLTRTAGLEIPEAVLHSVELHGDNSAATVLEACAANIDVEHRWQNGSYSVRRLETCSDSSPKPAIDPSASYLITGGLGALGLEAAKWLCASGAGSVYLSSRRAPTAEVQAKIDELTTQTTQVKVALGDVANPESLRSILAQTTEDLPLRGVIHAAGVLDDGMLIQQNWDRFEKVLAPKVHGCLNLIDQTNDLDFLLLYSSAASLMGSRGQSNYATANGIMDGLAAYANGLGCRTTAIQWGAWDTHGMAATLGQTGSKQRAAHGLGALSVADTSLLIEMALERQSATLGIVQVNDWNRVASALNTRAQQISPFVIPESLPIRPTAPATRQDQPKMVPAEVLDRALRQTLGFQDNQDIDQTQTLLEMGLDSMMAVDLRNRLNDQLAINLPMVLIMQGPTINELLTELKLLTTATTSAASRPKADPAEAVRRHICEVLGFRETDSLREDRSLLELGLDSMMAVEVRNRLNDELGINLPMVIIMQGPTVPELEAAVIQEVAQTIPAQAHSTVENPDAPEAVDTALERQLLTHLTALGIGGLLASILWWLTG